MKIHAWSIMEEGYTFCGRAIGSKAERLGNSFRHKQQFVSIVDLPDYGYTTCALCLKNMNRVAGFIHELTTHELEGVDTSISDD
jgi:hypothetical protein